jgi:hypothetical protein
MKSRVHSECFRRLLPEPSAESETSLNRAGDRRRRRRQAIASAFTSDAAAAYQKNIAFLCPLCDCQCSWYWRAVLLTSFCFCDKLMHFERWVRWRYG